MADSEHELLKYRLRIRGTSLSQIARELGVTPTALTQVSKGQYRSARVQSALADALGVKPEELFPSRYQDKEENKKAP